MNTFFPAAFVVVTFFSVILSEGASMVDDQLPVELKVCKRPQATTQWCWAASGQMVMEYLGTNVSQCDQANARFPAANNTCCGAPTSRVCNRPQVADYHKWGFNFQKTNNAALSKKQVMNEIDNNRPFTFTWYSPTGQWSHTMVAIGYTTESDQLFVICNNPLPVRTGSKRTLKYGEFVEGIDYANTGDAYQHLEDYYFIQKK
jgi:hypothetical protein